MSCTAYGFFPNRHSSSAMDSMILSSSFSTVAWMSTEPGEFAYVCCEFSQSNTKPYRQQTIHVHVADWPPSFPRPTQVQHPDRWSLTCPLAKNRSVDCGNGSLSFKVGKEIWIRHNRFWTQTLHSGKNRWRCQQHLFPRLSLLSMEANLGKPSRICLQISSQKA